MNTPTLLTESSTKDWDDTKWDEFHNWLKSMLKIGPATVTFIKKDGTERVMNCTLQAEQLPVVELKEDSKPRKESTTSLRVFDLEKTEWRSFTLKSVTRIQFTIEGIDNK